MKTRNKKATHVGVILSFVIFITFVIFIFVILKPTSNIQKGDNSNIIFLKKNIENFISAEITSFILSAPGIDFCFTLNGSVFGVEGLNYSVKNEHNTPIKSDQNANELFIEKDNSGNLYKVTYSPRNLSNLLLKNHEGCGVVTINSVRKTNQFIEPKIEELILKQEENYSGLKQDFNIPSEKEFGINFTFENETSMGKSLPDKKKATYIKKFQIIYLDLEAEERIGNFIIYIL